MREFNRTLLTETEFNEIKPCLLQAFEEFVPRSNFINQNDKTTKHNYDVLDNTEQPNLLSLPTKLAGHNLPNVKNFSEVFSCTSVYNLLIEKFNFIDNYVTNFTSTCKNSFITFSTNITGAKIGVKHLHSLLNVDCCHVFSFAVPLYIDNKSNDVAGFYFNSQEDLFPKRYYIDYERIKKLNIDYNLIALPKDGKILSLMFDGSRNPHYISYTNHLYAFLVFDGIELDYKLGKSWRLELL